MMERNTVQKIMRSEITWAIFIIGFLWGFVTTVVLPLQKLQIQVAQVQVDLKVSSRDVGTLKDDVSSLKTDVAVLKSKTVDKK